MTIVYEPADEHRHVVTIGYGDNGLGRLAFNHPAYWARPGTVLECSCGRTYVAQERRPGEMFSRWIREGWFARRRRQRHRSMAAR